MKPDANLMMVHKLVREIHKAIQRMPEGDRHNAYQRLRSELLKMPSSQASQAVMAILDPGFQNFQGNMNHGY